MIKYKNKIIYILIFIFIALGLSSCGKNQNEIEADKIYIESFDYDINRNKSTEANELSYSLSFDIDFTLNHKFDVDDLVVRVATTQEAIDNKKSFHLDVDYSNTEDVTLSNSYNPYILLNYAIADVTSLNVNAQIKITSKDLIDNINHFIKIECSCEAKEIADKNNLLNNGTFKMSYSDDSLIYYEFDEFNESYTVVSVVNRFDTLEVPATYKGYPVKVIGEGAFYNCSDLKNVTIPDSVIKIEEEAFKGCSSLTSITLPFVGASIDETEKKYFGYLFGASTRYDNSIFVPKSLKEVTITREKRIGDYTFADCSSLTSIKIPNSIESIGEFAFYGCDNLQYNEYQNAYYLGNEEKPYLVLMKAKSADITSCKIDHNTKVIFNFAFSNCKKLTNIVIPNSIISIGEDAFTNCDNLEYNEYDNACYLGNEDNPDLVLMKAKTTDVSRCEINNSAKFIYQSAFNNCSNLTSITIPDSVISIGLAIFSNCDRLVEIYNLSSADIVEINENNIKVIHKSLEEESILITKDDYLFFKEDNQFYLLYYSGTARDLVLPNDIEGNPYSIYKRAFSNFSNINSIIVPDSMINIGEAAFYNCSNLTSITLPYIGECLEKAYYTHFGYIFGAVSYSENSQYVPDSLKKVIITGGTSISEHAFEDCSNLTSISLPNSVGSIGEDAFSGCGNLQYNEYDNAYYLGNEDNPYLVLVKAKSKDISRCDINGNTKFIYQLAFYQCGGLISITVPNSIISIGNEAFSFCDRLIEIYNLSSLNIIIGNSDNGEIGNHVKIIHTSLGEESNLIIKDDYLFFKDNANKYYLIGYYGTETDLVLPNDIEGHPYDIYNEALSGLSTIKSITIPEGVTSIGEYAFEDCNILENIRLPNSLEHIGYGAFYGYNNLQYYEYDNGSYLGNEENPYLVLIKVKSMDISSCEIHRDTKIISNSVFENCSSLTSITIPNNVKHIGENAFAYCSGLTSIVLPNGVKRLGKRAFYNCSFIEHISIPNSIESIGEEAFAACYNLSYNTYDNASYLGNEENPYVVLIDAITWEISSCKIHNDTKIIYEHAFYNCINLISILIPNGVISIGNSAFSDCEKLTTITIPDSVTSIGSHVFHRCEITNIVLPNHITSIEISTFYLCVSLESIVIPNSVTTIVRYAFYECSSLKEVYYRGTSTEWKNLVIEDVNSYLTSATIYYYSETEPTEVGNYWHYVDGLVTKW